MRPLHSRLPRLHDLAAGRAGTFQEIRARDRRESLEIGQRILDRPIDHAVNNEAVSGRIDIRDAGVMPFVVQAGWQRSEDGWNLWISFGVPVVITKISTSETRG